MPDALLSRLVEERAARIQLIESLSTAAFEAERDLNPDDLETVTKAKERVSAIDIQLGAIADNMDLSEEVRTKLTKLSPQAVPGPVVYRSSGALLWDALHANYDRDAARRYGSFMKRAAEHMGTTAPATTPVAGGVPGLLVDPNVGPVIDVYPEGRPFLTTVGVTQAPRSMTFHRPYLVDTALDTGVAPQTLQKAELASKKFDVNRSDLALQTIGGYLNISQQLIEFAPEGLTLIVNELNRRYARATEKAALTELALSTSHVTLAAGATPAETLQAIYDASAMVYAQTGSLATWLAMGPLGWARLGGMVDLAGRPLFPTLGAANAPGTASADSFISSVAGLRAVVTFGIANDTFWVGNADGIEFYEYRFPLLETVEASVLGRQIAVAGAIASYRPYPGNGAVLIGP